MRRVVLVVAAMAFALLLASGVAWAVNKVGTNGPDTLRGTNGADNLLGRGGNDDLFGLGGSDNLLGGAGKDNVLGGNEHRVLGGDKTLAGGRGIDRILSGFGSDNLSGGPGNDFLEDFEFLSPGHPQEDKVSGGAGNDVVDVLNSPASEASEDIVVCGRGFDRVLADSEDVVAPDCERVSIGEASIDEFFESIPPNFFPSLPHF
jgi:Ca2+-binding RTX toxin-like protein